MGRGDGSGMEGRKQVAAAVRDYIARKHMSRDEFAFRTKLGKSTVDKLLTGLFSDRTLAIVEDHTQLSLRPLVGEQTEAVPAPAVGADRPSIAVLPFAYLGGDPAQDFLADGITEDVITGLARLRWLFVIARNSVYVYKDRAVDVREVARALGVRYVLEGTVRAAGERIRVTGQLVDAETGKHIWAERYDREMQDILTVQDEITERVIAAVEPHLYAEEGDRAALRLPESLDAWGLVARATDLIHRIDRTHIEEAQRLLRRAIAIDPGYARAHALLGWATLWAVRCYWAEPWEVSLPRAEAHAQEALALDPRDPWARMIAGFCLSTAGQHARGLEELRMALTLNPSFALGHSFYGWALLRVGDYDKAIEATSRALELSPLDNYAGLYTSTHGLALLGARRFEEALPFLLQSVASFGGYAGHYNTLVSCCGHLGLIEQAREFIAARERIEAPFRLGPFRTALAGFAHADVFIEGLAKAGVPE